MKTIHIEKCLTCPLKEFTDESGNMKCNASTVTARKNYIGHFMDNPEIPDWCPLEKQIIMVKELESNKDGKI